MQHRVSPPKLRRLGANLAALAVGAGHPIIDEGSANCARSVTT